MTELTQEQAEQLLMELQKYSYPIQYKGANGLQTYYLDGDGDVCEGLLAEVVIHDKKERKR